MLLKTNCLLKDIMLSYKNKSNLMVANWRVLYLALSTWDITEELGEKSTSFTKLILEPTEAFTDFLQRLYSAVNRAIADPEKRQSLIEVLAFENVTGFYKWDILYSPGLTYFLLALYYCESSIIYNFICDHSVTMFFSCSNPYINQILSFVLLCSVRSADCCLVWIICSFLPQLWRFLLLTGIRKSFLPVPPIWAPAPSSMPPSFYYALS